MQVGSPVPEAWVQVLASPLAACETLGKFNPWPQFPCLYNGNDINHRTTSENCHED